MAEIRLYVTIKNPSWLELGWSQPQWWTAMLRARGARAVGTCSCLSAAKAIAVAADDETQTTLACMHNCTTDHFTRGLKGVNGSSFEVNGSWEMVTIITVEGATHTTIMARFWDVKGGRIQV